MPSAATTGNVVVTVSGVASNGKSFTVIPHIITLSPASGTVGASVTITGTTFGSTQGSSTVKFNGTTATPTSWSSTQIVAPVPTGATTGNVIVTVSGKASAGVSFTVIATPTISSLSPSSGAVGASITISGTNFQPTQGSSTITFNGTAATPTSWTATKIIAPVPAGATTGNVVVTCFGLASNGKTFTVKPTPTITSVSPTFGAVGILVTISGTNFGSSQGSSTVTFNGTKATPTSWNANQINVPVPSGAKTGNLVVTASGVGVNGGTFTVETLSSIAVTPASLSLPLNSPQQYTATATYSDGSKQSLGANATWNSSDTSIATVNTSGLLAAIGQGQATIQAAFDAVNGSTLLTVTGPSFVSVGNLITGRWEHTATLLTNGQVLIVGGQDANNNILASAELYNPSTGEFSATGSLRMARESHTATLLPNGTVLIAGGNNLTSNIAAAELYNPATGTFSYTTGAGQASTSQSAVLLNNGTVLLVGGSYFPSGQIEPAPSQIYDPNTETFSLTASLINPHESAQTATLLNDGTVLVAGGAGTLGYSTTDAEIYNPTTASFTVIGSLGIARTGHTATLLSNGQVLITGGNDDCPAGNCPSALNEAELYDPVAKAFSVTTSIAIPREFSTATLLSNGSVLIVGGQTLSADTGTAELFNPTNTMVTGAGSLEMPRAAPTATLLQDGTVLIAGGIGQTALASAELYEPTPPAPSSLQVTPSTVNMQVGQTQQFTAVDNLGHPRSDVTWMVSNMSVVSITSDSSPVLTALAAGSATVTATDGSASAQAQVTIVPVGSITPGTALWSVPALSGFTPLQLTQAMPSPTGPGMYSIQLSNDGTRTFVQAMTNDGQQLWQNELPAVNANTVADASGGLLVTENQTCNTGQTAPMTIVDTDPTSGEPLWQVIAQGIPGAGPQGSTLYCYPDAPQMVIRSAIDGAVVISAPGNTSGLPELSVLNGQTGQPLTNQPSIPLSSYEQPDGTFLNGYSPIGPPIVDSNGITWVEYEVRQIAYPPKVTSATLYLLKVATNGLQTSIQLSSTTSDENLFPERLIPDGQGGILATWVISPSNPPIPMNPYQAAYVVSGAVTATYNLPFTPRNFVLGPDGLPIEPMLVLGENGVAFATDGKSSGDITNNEGPKIVSFNLASGTLNWFYQETSTSATFSIMTAIDGNGLEVNDSLNGVVQFDSSGNASSVTASLGGVAQPSWSGNWALLNSQGASAPFISSITLPDSFWAMPGGNESGNGGAIEQVQTNQTQGLPHQIPSSSATPPCLFTGNPDLQFLCSNYNSIELLTTVAPSTIFSKYIQTFFGAQPHNNDVATVQSTTDVTGPGQNVTFTMLGLTGRLMQIWPGSPNFSVQSERFDTSANTLSVVTLQGHPIAGWRYWRAYSIGTNDVVVETGAVDTWGPSLNYLGYWTLRGLQLKLWREYLLSVLVDIQFHLDGNVVEGTNPTYKHVNGVWNPGSPSQSDILYQVCQSSTCN